MPALAPSPALLVLEDGRTFRGDSYGAAGETFGEAVFSTGMTGYQETLTDPAYHRQVVVMTAPAHRQHRHERRGPGVLPHLGRRLRRARPRPRARRAGGRGAPSTTRCATRASSASPAIDTRALTRHLRERGAMRVGISSTETDAEALLERVLAVRRDGRRQPVRRGDSTAEAYVVPAVRASGGSPSLPSTSASRPTPRG